MQPFFTPTRPVVLALGGLDPSGGAGLAADVLAISAVGAHPAPIATAITVQDTKRAYSFAALPVAQIEAQAQAVSDDMPIAWVKAGMLASAATAAWLGAWVQAQGLPLLLDPVLGAGGGGNLAQEPLLYALRQLLPAVTLLTPNGVEARRLAGLEPTAGLAECAQALWALGAQQLLITGGHEAESSVVSRYYQAGSLCWERTTPRLTGEFHGSGCTFAASLAAYLAQGQSILTALGNADDYTSQTLRHAYRAGQGQLIPRR